jgi:hypothetical protein
MRTWSRIQPIKPCLQGRYTDEMANRAKRRFQFSLWTLFVVVTVAAALAGAIRWLVILTGERVSFVVLVAISFTALWVRLGSWGDRLRRKWARGRDAREQLREREATSKLLELPGVKEAIVAAKSANLQNPERPPAPRC